MAQELFAIKSGMKPGPTENNGGSAPYHIDGKVPKKPDGTPDYEFTIKLLNAMARTKGLRLEFSNKGVADEVWNPDASPAQQMALVKRVLSAHKQYDQWDSFDVYALRPDDKNRDSKGIDSNPLDIPLVLAQGWRAEFDTGGRYGNHVMVYDENNKLVYKMGHGDDRLNLPKNINVTQEFLVVHNITLPSSKEGDTTLSPPSVVASVTTPIKPFRGSLLDGFSSPSTPVTFGFADTSPKSTPAVTTPPVDDHSHEHSLQSKHSSALIQKLLEEINIKREAYATKNIGATELASPMPVTSTSPSPTLTR